MLQLARETRTGTTVYIDGRFHNCLARLRLGGDGLEDVLVLEHIPFNPHSAGVLSRISAGDLDRLEKAGRAALVGRWDQRPPAETPRGPASPDNGAAAVELDLA